MAADVPALWSAAHQEPVSPRFRAAPERGRAVTASSGISECADRKKLFREILRLKIIPSAVCIHRRPLITADGRSLVDDPGTDIFRIMAQLDHL